MQFIGSSVWFVTIISLMSITNTNSFIIISKTRKSSVGMYHFMSSGGNNDSQVSSAQKKQEQRMEMSSIAGAEAISKLDVNERTKRVCSSVSHFNIRTL